MRSAINKLPREKAVRIRDNTGFSPLFSARTACPAGDIRQDYPLPFRLFEQKIAGEKLLRTAADAIFVKDKAQGSDNPDGYPTPATRYFANKCTAAAYKSLSEGASRGPLFYGSSDAKKFSEWEKQHEKDGSEPDT